MEKDSIDYKKATNYWKEKDAISKKMEHDSLFEEIEKYIMANNTCALATGFGTFIRCTPVDYSYYYGALWIFSEGGDKFIGLENNKNISLAIYDKNDNFGKLKGMQIAGIADIIEPFSKEYNEIANLKKIPLETLKKLPTPMNLIKITPKKIDYLNSEFKKNGFSIRQSIEF